MIVVIIVLYTLIGIEIVKRRRAMNAINSQTFAFDDTVLAAAPSEASYCEPNKGVAITSEFGIQSQPGYLSTSHSANESLISASKQYTPTSFQPQSVQQPKLSSLSFKQYVLMPVFFFLALLSVWVCPSTNRVASFVNPSFAS